MKYSLESFMEAKRKGTLKEWAIEYLLSDGNNKHLAKHLAERKTVWVDMFEYPLKKLRREMGHKDEGLAFNEDKESWDKRINSFKTDILNGYTPPPLFATDFWDDVHIADGAHRHEALLRAGYDKYWVVFFIERELNKKLVLKD